MLCTLYDLPAVGFKPTLLYSTGTCLRTDYLDSISPMKDDSMPLLIGQTDPFPDTHTLKVSDGACAKMGLMPAVTFVG